MCFDKEIGSNIRRFMGGLLFASLTITSNSVTGSNQDASEVCFEVYTPVQESDSLVLLRLDEDVEQLAPICRQDGICIDSGDEPITDLIDASGSNDAFIFEDVFFSGP